MTIGLGIAIAGVWMLPAVTILNIKNLNKNSPNAAVLIAFVMTIVLLIFG